MTDSEHDRIAELLGAYALHAVDADERAAVDAHLLGCPRCRAEVSGHELVAALLGNSGGDAPDGVWDRIVSTLEETPPPMRLDLGSGGAAVIPLAGRTPGRTRRERRWALAVGAAAAAVVITLLGAEVVRQDDRIDTLHQALAETAVVRAANLALSDPGAVRADLRSSDGKVHATAVVLPDGAGYLMAQDMPRLGRDRTYQLWGKTPGGLISLGVLGNDPGDVVAFHGTSEVAALAVTDEAAPGVVASKNAPALSGALS